MILRFLHTYIYIYIYFVKLNIIYLKDTREYIRNVLTVEIVGIFNEYVCTYSWQIRNLLEMELGEIVR